MGRLLGFLVSALAGLGVFCLNTLADGQAPRISRGGKFRPVGYFGLNTLADGQAPRISHTPGGCGSHQHVSIPSLMGRLLGFVDKLVILHFGK